MWPPCSGRSGRLDCWPWPGADTNNNYEVVVSMMLNIHTETIRLIRDRERGKLQALVYDILISFKVEEGAGKRCSECGRGVVV